MWVHIENSNILKTVHLASKSFQVSPWEGEQALNDFSSFQIQV